MIDPSAFKNPATGQIDQMAYSLALQLAGEQCPRCRNLLAVPIQTPGMCHHCHALERNPGPVIHPRRIRCPRCKHQNNCDEPCFFTNPAEPGPHTHRCEVCGQHFTFNTHAQLGIENERMFAPPPTRLTRGDMTR